MCCFCSLTSHSHSGTGMHDEQPWADLKRAAGRNMSNALGPCHILESIFRSTTWLFSKQGAAALTYRSCHCSDVKLRIFLEDFPLSRWKNYISILLRFTRLSYCHCWIEESQAQSVEFSISVNKQHSDVTVLILQVREDWAKGSGYSIRCGSVGSESILVRIQAGRNVIVAGELDSQNTSAGWQSELKGGSF